MTLVLAILLWLAAQEDNKPEQTSIPCSCQTMLTDPLGNVYTLDQARLNKYDRQGKKLAHYTDSKLGPISYADVSKPMRILLFYEDFNQILFLDNYLTPLRSPVLLDDLGIRHATMACSSAQNGFWVFDEQSFTLARYDENLQEIHRSPSLNMIAKLDGEISQMTENNNQLYMAVPGTGIFIFDIYGSYIKTISLPQVSRFQAKSGELLYPSGGYWLSHKLKLAHTDTLMPTGPGLINLQTNAGQTYLHYKDSIVIR